MNEPFVALVNSTLTDAHHIQRLFDEKDIAAAFNTLNFTTEEEVTHYLTRQLNAEIIPGFFQSVRLTYHEGPDHNDSNSLFAGVVFLYHASSTLVTDNSFPALGFALSPAHRGLGVMHTALANLLQTMIESGFPYVSALVHPQNQTALALLEKTGFIQLEASDDELLYTVRLAISENDFNRDFQVGN